MKSPPHSRYHLAYAEVRIKMTGNRADAGVASTRLP